MPSKSSNEDYVMSNDSNQQFKVHSLLNIDPSISLVKIGELTAEQLKAATDSFTNCVPVGWESALSDSDKALSEKYHFNVDACTAAEDFVMFGFSKHEQKKSQLKILFDLCPESAHVNFGVLTCDSYFAHKHNDRDTVDSSGQIMFVVDNEANHVLYSQDSSGLEHTLVPKKGDVILLDVWLDHAVFPDQSKGLDFMREHGMKLVCFALD